MNKNIKNIINNKILLLRILKKNININILKSIKQNNNINSNINTYSTMLLQHINVKKKIFKSKQHKVCMFTGKHGGVIKQFDLSRYKVKDLLIANKLTNVKKKNW